MPGRNGVDLLTEVHERWPETVRIIVTGCTDTDDIIRAINEAGIYQSLTKPWHPDQLVMAANAGARLFAFQRDHDRMSLEPKQLGTTAEARLADRRAAVKRGRDPGRAARIRALRAQAGAFTVAHATRLGLLQQAGGGTVFLDEIGDTSPAFQVKLLRFPQDGEIQPVGSNETRSVDVRVIAAINRDLEEEARAGRSREDLY